MPGAPGCRRSLRNMRRSHVPVRGRAGKQSFFYGGGARSRANALQTGPPTSTTEAPSLVVETRTALGVLPPDGAGPRAARCAVWARWGFALRTWAPSYWTGPCLDRRLLPARTNVFRVFYPFVRPVASCLDNEVLKLELHRFPHLVGPVGAPPSVCTCSATPVHAVLRQLRAAFFCPSSYRRGLIVAHWQGSRPCSKLFGLAQKLREACSLLDLARFTKKSGLRSDPSGGPPHARGGRQMAAHPRVQKKRISSSKAAAADLPDTYPHARTLGAPPGETPCPLNTCELTAVHGWYPAPLWFRPSPAPRELVGRASLTDCRLPSCRSFPSWRPMRSG
jgi:hypothetical protein